MKFLTLFCAVILTFSMVISCKQKATEITPEIFIQMENDVLKTDLTPKATEEVADKYGFTLKQYRDYESLVESDMKLKEKIGEIRLNETKRKP